MTGKLYNLALKALEVYNANCQYKLPAYKKDGQSLSHTIAAKAVVTQIAVVEDVEKTDKLIYFLPSGVCFMQNLVLMADKYLTECSYFDYSSFNAAFRSIRGNFSAIEFNAGSIKNNKKKRHTFFFFLLIVRSF